MTKILDIRELDDCLDSTWALQVELDVAIDEALMRRLARGGKLEYHPEFPRPYFRITQPGAWIAQGVIGNRCFRVTGSLSQWSEPARQLRDQIEEGELADGSKA